MNEHLECTRKQDCQARVIKVRESHTLEKAKTVLEKKITPLTDRKNRAS